MNTYKLTLIALLAAIAVVGRITLSFIPNIQPVTAMIIICGILLGPVAAILLALLTTFLSNMLLGMGIWTIWQIVSWSIIGIASGVLGNFFRNIPIYIIVIFSIISGYFYGFIISLTQYQITGKFLPYYLAGLAFDTNHAIGNALFIILFYPIFTYFLKRYSKDRFNIQRS
ncbi:ECF transporter S component [Ornithinibacillus sp. L9]|uniref:ECF transporter S component n=1 Tax=Ornithinibacillus caprae TaxID=2678566 RepID=A0A6N8FHL7_9BACI|nr:ECF transporter S component [Ornithinibacillus caprae]